MNEMKTIKALTLPNRVAVEPDLEMPAIRTKYGS